MDNGNVRNKVAYFAAGCFWHVEETFRCVPGVISTRTGYVGGSKENPTYEEVCSGKTGHAEAVEVIYDPEKIDYSDLLDVFWKEHDPTTLNRQGPDIGSQYRSAIFYADETQREAAETSLKFLEGLGKYPSPIVTEIVPLKEFFEAEEYHQKYIVKRGGAACAV